jgi:hypothetical protein
MSVLTYKVQTWNLDGALTNSYLADVDGPAALEELRKFLRKTHAHVTLVRMPDKPAKKAKRR